MADNQEPSYKLHDFIVNDIKALATLAVRKNGAGNFDPMLLAKYQESRKEFEKIEAEWDLANAKTGQKGEIERALVVRKLAIFAQKLHESIPGAPPTPEAITAITKYPAKPSPPPHTGVDAALHAQQVAEQGVKDAANAAAGAGKKLAKGAKEAVEDISFGLGLIAVIALVALVLIWGNRK